MTFDEHYANAGFGWGWTASYAGPFGPSPRSSDRQKRDNKAPEPSEKEAKERRNRFAKGFDGIDWGPSKAQKVSLRVVPGSIPNGEHEGRWYGLLIVFRAGNGTYELTTSEWGLGQEARVSVVGGTIVQVNIQER